MGQLSVACFVGGTSDFIRTSISDPSFYKTQGGFKLVKTHHGNEWRPGRWTGCHTFQSNTGGIYELVGGQSVGCFIGGTSDSIRTSVSDPRFYKTKGGFKLHGTGHL